MKILKLFSVFLVLSIISVGCWSTGLRSVKNSNLYLNITNFNENVFFTTIWYDYSKIKDFNELNVHAILERDGFTSVPGGTFAYDANSIWFNNSYLSIELKLLFWRMYLSDTDEFGNPKTIKSEREDPYHHREPGKLVIWSIDSAGTYRLEYRDNI